MKGFMRFLTRSIFYLLVSVILLTFAGCHSTLASQSPASTEIPLLLTPTLTQTIQPNVVRGPWNTPLPSWTPRPTITVTTTPTPVVFPDCSSSGEILPFTGKEGLQGVITYLKTDPETGEQINGLWMADAAQPAAERILHPELEISSAQFSPDGQWLVYTPYEYQKELEDQHAPYLRESSLILLSNQGKEKIIQWDLAALEKERLERIQALDKTYTEEPTSIFLTDIHWLDHNMLQVDFITRILYGDERIEGVMTRLFDPLTETWQDSSWWNSLKLRETIAWGYKPLFLSNSQTKIIFVQNNDIHVFDLSTESLVQLTTKAESSRLITVNWSPDDRNVILTDYQGRLTLFDLKDELTQLLSEDYPQKATNARAEWSPDGKYIGITVHNYSDTENSSEGTFYLYDVSKHQYQCQSSISIQGYSLEMVWSPDGKWILLGDGESPLKMMDVRNGRLYQWGDDWAVPTGWSYSFSLSGQ